MAPPKDLVSEQRLRESFVKHAVYTQLHRLCHHRQRTLDDAPDDLRAALVLMRDAAPGTSHALDRCSIDLAADGLVAFSASFAEGEAWQGAFRRTREFLPELVTLDIAQGRFTSAEPSGDHRIRATIHYFIALVENPARDPEPFAELLADAFSLHYTDEPLRDFDAVRSWVTGRLASVVASEHDIHSIVCRSMGDDCHSAEVAMKSQALFPDGAGAISRNNQCWTLRDDPTERFARINEILIDRDAVEFFGPAPDYEARALPG